jgi:hypothetical protein
MGNMGTRTVEIPGAALRAMAVAVADAWEVGDGLGDGFLEVRRTPMGYVVRDGESGDPADRPATREEALEFVAAIAQGRDRE